MGANTSKSSGGGRTIHGWDGPRKREERGRWLCRPKAQGGKRHNANSVCLLQEGVKVGPGGRHGKGKSLYKDFKKRDKTAPGTYVGPATPRPEEGWCAGGVGGGGGGLFWVDTEEQNKQRKRLGRKKKQPTKTKKNKSTNRTLSSPS